MSNEAVVNQKPKVLQLTIQLYYPESAPENRLIMYWYVDSRYPVIGRRIGDTWVEDVHPLTPPRIAKTGQIEAWNEIPDLKK